jgi:hypothetical protein
MAALTARICSQSAKPHQKRRCRPRKKSEAKKTAHAVVSALFSRAAVTGEYLSACSF